MQQTPSAPRGEKRLTRNMTRETLQLETCLRLKLDPMPSSALGYGKPPGTKRPKNRKTQKPGTQKPASGKVPQKHVNYSKVSNLFWPRSSLTSSAVCINEKVHLLELYGTCKTKINAVNIPPRSRSHQGSLALILSAAAVFFLFQTAVLTNFSAFRFSFRSSESS